MSRAASRTSNMETDPDGQLDEWASILANPVLYNAEQPSPRRLDWSCSITGPVEGHRTL
jgi:hypothetical protein